MADEPTLRIRGQLDLSDARKELATFADEAKLRLNARGGMTGGGSNLGPDRVGTSELRYASAMERLAAATERRAAATERAAVRTNVEAGGNPLDTTNWGAVPYSGLGGGGGGNRFGAVVAGLRGMMPYYGAGAALNALSSSNQAVAAANINAMGPDTVLERNAATQRQLSANSFWLRQQFLGIVSPEDSDAAIGERLAQSSRIYSRSREVFASQIARTTAQAGRAGFARGGEVGERRSLIGAGAAGAELEMQHELDVLRKQQPDWKSLTNDGDRTEYVNRAQKIGDLESKLQENREATRFETQKLDNQRSIAGAAIRYSRYGAEDTANSMPMREASRRALERQQELEYRRQEQADRTLLPALTRKHLAELSAYDVQAGREAGFSNILNQSAATAARFAGANEGALAQLSGMQGSQAVELERARLHDPATVASLEQRQKADTQAVIAQTMRGIGIRTSGNLGAAEVTSLLLARDPLAASLAGNELARSQELKSMGMFEKLMMGGSVNARYAAQGALIRQQWSDQRELGMIGLEGGLASSSLRAQGRGFSAGALDSVNDTIQRARSFGQQGLQEEKRLALATGIEDLLTMQRRVQFGGFGEEIAPGTLGPTPGMEERVTTETSEEYLKAIKEGIEKLQDILGGNGE